MSKSLSKSSVLLQCSLCPKTPRFSDVSHLLTHVSSKSHLSHRFKLQIRAQNEPKCRQQLDIFETWYAENSLDDLLSERLTAKTQKRTNPPISKRRESSAFVKKEAQREQPCVVDLAWQAPIPRMHNWSTGGTSTTIAAGNFGSVTSQLNEYATPSMKKDLPNFSQSHQTLGFCDSGFQAAPKSDGTEYEFDLDNSKLKGVFWPGMNLFDSATAEMRRMRNQRKDGSVLAQMRSNSGVVEPTEWVFNADGSFRKVRDVYDDNTDSAGDKSEDDILPSIKRRRGRKAMANLSANIPSLRSSTTSLHSSNNISKRVSKRRTQKTSDIVDPFDDGFHNLNKRTELSKHHFAPGLEYDEDFSLTTGEGLKRRRLGIFRDVEEDSPGRTESPLEERRFEFSHGLMPPPNMNEMRPLQSPLPKPIPIKINGKENMYAQRVERPGFSSNHGLPPQAFHDHGFNPLFYHQNSHPASYADHAAYASNSKPQQSSFMGDFMPMMPLTYEGYDGTHAHSTGLERGNSVNFHM